MLAHCPDLLGRVASLPTNISACRVVVRAGLEMSVKGAQAEFGPHQDFSHDFDRLVASAPDADRVSSAVRRASPGAQMEEVSTWHLRSP